MAHTFPISFPGRFASLVAACLLVSGCSIRSMAVNKVGDALAETGSNFASDEDPELVGDAIPFGLKTMEGLLESAPKHEGLLLAASSGFVQYAYGWVQMPGDVAEATDLARATELRERARKLYLRARGYGLRGLEVDFPGLGDALARDPKAALARTKKEHVPLLYWTAMGWAGAMSLKVNDSDVSADQLRVLVRGEVRAGFGERVADLVDSHRADRAARDEEACCHEARDATGEREGEGVCHEAGDPTILPPGP